MTLNYPAGTPSHQEVRATRPASTTTAKKPKKQKYNNVKTNINGITFDSKREAAHYVELLQLVAAGIIVNLELQPQFRVEVNGAKICDYYADFAYVDVKSGKRIIIDVKGVRTPVFRIKKKLVEALYGIEIVEVK